MRQMHLSTSAVAYIAFFNGLGPSRHVILMDMIKNGIKDNYPAQWACGTGLRSEQGFNDACIRKDGIYYDGKLGHKVTCPKCIEMIKKYGEK